MARGEPVRHMERVLLADGERVGLESTHVAVARAPALDTGFDPDSSLLRPPPRGAGIAFGDADERIETVLAAPREALLIGTPPALPMLHRLSRGTGGRPMERVRTLFRGDRFSFRTRLGPVPGLTRSVRAPHLRSREEGELLAFTGDVQMDVAQPKEIPNLGIRFPAQGDGPATHLRPAVRRRPGRGRPALGERQGVFRLLPPRARPEGRRGDRRQRRGPVPAVEGRRDLHPGLGRRRKEARPPRRRPEVGHRQLTPAAGLPTAGMRASDPRTWSAEDWASDIVPHLAYGW